MTRIAVIGLLITAAVAGIAPAIAAGTGNPDESGPASLLVPHSPYPAKITHETKNQTTDTKFEIDGSAGMHADAGSVSFDRAVYPVPFGGADDPSRFALHSAAGRNQYLDRGDLNVHIRIIDSDFDLNPSGEDKIAEDEPVIEVKIERGSASTTLVTAGTADNPIHEVAPASGIFEYELTIEYDDGPGDADGGVCPADFGDGGCVLQGDVLLVTYTDPADASGDKNTVTDSATFDLRNGALQSDRSAYVVGSDMILTLIEPDFDLDGDAAETYDLDLIGWDSDAATISMGDLGGAESDGGAAFDPRPADFGETGDSTGIFQVVIGIPEELGGDRLERGEEFVLEYADWGPSSSHYVGDGHRDISLTIHASDFGAAVELDQKVYTWTDKVYITVVSPDHNYDPGRVDEIGRTEEDSIKISTREAELDNYRLVETGMDTGVFTGEVILTGFSGHDADDDGIADDASGEESNDFGGPTDGLLPSGNDDSIAVSFGFSENETMVASAPIRWNIGEVRWLKASYSETETGRGPGIGIFRIIDPDMNLDPEAVDDFEAVVTSDKDSIHNIAIETGEATGIFEGIVHFVYHTGGGHRLLAMIGDTVTIQYDDRTLPESHTTADGIDITATITDTVQVGIGEESVNEIPPEVELVHFLLTDYDHLVNMPEWFDNVLGFWEGGEITDGQFHAAADWMLKALNVDQQKIIDASLKDRKNLDSVESGEMRLSSLDYPDKDYFIKAYAKAYKYAYYYGYTYGKHAAINLTYLSESNGTAPPDLDDYSKRYSSAYRDGYDDGWLAGFNDYTAGYDFGYGKEYGNAHTSKHDGYDEFYQGAYDDGYGGGYDKSWTEPYEDLGGVTGLLDGLDDGFKGNDYDSKL